jgi:hypothetical protein
MIDLFGPDRSSTLLVPVLILLRVVAAATILLGGLVLPGPTRRFLDRDPQPWTVTAVVLTFWSSPRSPVRSSSCGTSSSFSRRAK